VSVTLASAFLGCAISGTIADSFGRRRAFQISCVPMIIGAIIRWFHSSSYCRGLRFWQRLLKSQQWNIDFFSQIFHVLLFCSCLILHPGYLLIKLWDARHLHQAFLSTDVHLHVIWQCNFHTCWSYDFWTIHSWTWIRTIRPSNSHVCVRGTVATAPFSVLSSSAIKDISL
jgi:hypothetical protein